MHNTLERGLTVEKRIVIGVVDAVMAIAIVGLLGTFAGTLWHGSPEQFEGYLWVAGISSVASGLFGFTRGDR